MVPLLCFQFQESSIVAHEQGKGVENLQAGVFIHQPHRPTRGFRKVGSGYLFRLSVIVNPFLMQGLMENLLPRHMELIYRINHLFLEEVGAKFPDVRQPSRTTGF